MRGTATKREPLADRTLSHPGRYICRIVIAATISMVFLISQVHAKGRFEWIDFYFDEAPYAPHALGSGFSFGVTLELDTEGEFNLNLDRDDNEDEVLFMPQLELGILYDNNSQLRAYLEVELSRDLELKAPDQGSPDTKLEIKQANVTLLSDDRNLALTVGRWSVSDEREWLFDEDLDGVQLVWRGENLAAEFLYAREEILQKDLFEARSTGNPDHLYGRLYGPVFEDSIASIYGLYQHGRGPGSADLFWIGGSLIGKVDHGINYWTEAAGVSGTEDGRSVRGFGLDIGLTKEFEHMRFNPRLTGAFAFGTGDDGSGRDTAYRQTGIQGNGDRFGGRKSFKYYGEAFDPELSNLGIVTLGAGINISEKTTIDLVYHHYFQHQKMAEIRDSALDEDPSGDSGHIGDELDVVIAIRELEKVDIDLIGAVFLPGKAFDGADNPAWFAGVEFKVSF